MTYYIIMKFVWRDKKPQRNLVSGVTMATLWLSLEPVTSQMQVMSATAAPPHSV